MATIRKRGNKYQFTVSLGRGMDGKQIRESMTYTPTARTSRAIEKEVAAAAHDFEKTVKEGKYLTGEKISFEEFHEKYYLPQWSKNHLTLSQQEKYEDYVRRYGYPALKTLKISRIKPLHIQGIMESMQNAGYAPATMRDAHTALNSVFRYAYRMQIIQDNPCCRVELPKMNADIKLHYFTRDQALTFLDFLKEPFISTTAAHDRIDDTGKGYHVTEYTASYNTQYQFRVYFNLSIYGGFRRGELIALQWRDIDFKKSTISIKRAAAQAQTSHTVYIKEPKTKKSIRTIVMPSESMNLLREWKKRQRQLCLQLGSQWQGKRGREYDENFVFIQIGNGLMMHLDTPGQKFKKLIARYNEIIDYQIKEGSATEDDKLPNIRLHDLRHTSATILIGNGADIHTVAHRLGHSRVSITLDRYSHPLPENDKKAAAILEKVFAR